MVVVFLATATNCVRPPLLWLTITTDLLVEVVSGISTAVRVFTLRSLYDDAATANFLSDVI